MRILTIDAESRGLKREGSSATANYLISVEKSSFSFQPPVIPMSTCDCTLVRGRHRTVV